MSGSRLTVVRHGTARPVPAAGETIISTDDLKAWLRSGGIATRLLGWSEARLLTERIETLGRPLPAALLMRLMCRGACYASDAAGRRRELSLALLARWARQAATEPFLRASLVQQAEREVTALEHSVESGPMGAALDRSLSPLYLRADVSFGVKAGGSVGHTAGVINHLGESASPPIVLTTDRIATLAERLEVHDIVPEEAFWHYRELPAIVMNRSVMRTAADVLGDRRIGFVYQRYTLHGYAAVVLARAHRVPLVTEYNGSEVWVARHWGQPLTHETLAIRIEQLNLRAADLVSVVSAPLAREVEALGVDPARVLVNPNGVDIERYHPNVDGAAVRTRLGLGDATVIGFIGTFGPWHGAEVLAEAAVLMFQSHPDWRTTVRVLFIGDGVGLPRVKTIVEEGGITDCCVFTGLVAQERGAEYLAACDILASPHVPNADGSAFFGSPTKLFEYMAMGRGIVASDLDQIGEVLDDGRTALLVRPGDPHALAAAVSRLVTDATLRASLGAAARRAAVERHTWRAHVARTVDALAHLNGTAAA